MPSIRRRYHFSTVILMPEPLEGESSVCGQTVDVLMKGGDFERIHLLGFKPISECSGEHWVKIIRIVAFNKSEDIFDQGWVDVGVNSVVLGEKDKDRKGVWICIDGDVPVCWSPLIS